MEFSSICFDIYLVNQLICQNNWKITAKFCGLLRKDELYVMNKEHSVEEVLERPTGYPKVGGSNHGSGDFSLQPQRNPYLS